MIGKNSRGGIDFIARALSDLRPTCAIGFEPEETDEPEVEVGDSVVDVMMAGIQKSAIDLTKQIETMGYLSSEERAELNLSMSQLIAAWKMDLGDACQWAAERRVDNEVVGLIGGLDELESGGDL